MDVSPLYGLRLRTPRTELRLGTRSELVELGQLAERGVHPPCDMPFSVAWTDAIGEPGFLDGFVSYHEHTLAGWAPDAWTLNLLVWAEGDLAGTQALSATAFAAERAVDTGSWLGAPYQGRGLGTEMRAAVLELAFAGLGAGVARSAWLAGNESSRRVSEKLGYRPVGRREERPRGEPVVATVVAIDRRDWSCPVPVEIHGLDACRELFGAH